MRKNELVAIILTILSTIGIIVAVFGIEKHRKGKYYTVELIARAPEHGNWYPNKIKIPLGKEANILIRNIETVTHGFALPDFDITTEIKGGEVKLLKFIPNKKGTFPFMCNIWCSDRHMEMTGELVVE